MLPVTSVAYGRRRNLDGTTDSICRKCFVTVATARQETDLHCAEHSHTCDPNVLEYWNRAMESGEER